VFEGRPTSIDGVMDSYGSIVGTRVVSGDPVDLPVGDGVAGLVVLHVPRFLDPGRHHQRSPGEYLAWLVEVIDEAERVLEVGGRLVLVAKPLESDQPRIDVPTQLTEPLATAGFTEPLVHTWLPDPSDGPEPDRPGSDRGRSVVLEGSARSWWRVLIASKGQEHRAGSTRQRRRAGLPHRAGTVPDHVARLAGRAHWPITAGQTGRAGRAVAQGDLPDGLVELLVSCFSYVDDVVVCPLTGESPVVAGTARRLRRRALCFEPDPAVLDRLTTSQPLSVDPVEGGRSGEER
jgi:hypothetical protein